MKITVRHIITAILIILLQVLVFRNFSFVFNSYLGFDIIFYPVLVFILPIFLSTNWVLVVCFISGLIIDAFYGTPGLHTSALLMTGFFRSILIKLMMPRNGYLVDDEPLTLKHSNYWYFIYAAGLLFIHLFFLYLFDIFELKYFAKIISYTFLSFLATMSFIIIHYFLSKTIVTRK